MPTLLSFAVATVVPDMEVWYSISAINPYGAMKTKKPGGNVLLALLETEATSLMPRAGLQRACREGAQELSSSARLPQQVLA
jgi:hypothetical protein